MSLPLLRGRISLQDALADDENVLENLSFPQKRLVFWLYLYRHRAEISRIVSRHLNLTLSEFRLGEVDEWIHGSFNAILPIHITASSRNPNLPPRAIIRFPLPYKIGEESCPGNLNEKVRCEAATYIWLQRHSTIPIPRLFGFGFPDSPSLKTSRFQTRSYGVVEDLRRGYGGDALPFYFAHSRPALLDTGYLVVEYVEGKMLSDSWEMHRHDPNRRSNFFQDLSKMMLSLAKHPLPRIGSWSIDNRGILTLTNRPLTVTLHQLENSEIPTEIPRNLTYTSAESYFLDLLTCHDSRIVHQPNSIHDQRDGEQQLSALVAMKALLPTLIERKLRNDFVLFLTDSHQSNIILDDNWHIKCFIDLEWACVRPIQMLSPPFWLCCQAIDQIIVHLDEYAKLHHEFLDVFEKEELEQYSSRSISQMMRSCWETGSFWFTNALDSPSALSALFIDHIQPKFAHLGTAAREESDRRLMPYWKVDTPDFVKAKIKEEEAYCSRLREIFAAGENDLVEETLKKVDSEQ